MRAMCFVNCQSNLGLIGNKCVLKMSVKYFFQCWPKKIIPEVFVCLFVFFRDK